MRLSVPFALALVAAVGVAGTARGEADPEMPVPPPPPPEPVPPPSRAAPPAPAGTPHTALYIINGLGTPVGFLGIEAVHLFGKWVEISGGVGAGGEALIAKPKQNGVLQWAVMPRLRAGGDHVAFTFGTGVSGGNYAKGGGSGECYFVCTDPPPAQYTIWANVEIGVEAWTGRRSHFAVRAFVGAAHGWVVDDQPLDIPGEGVGSPTIAYTGVGLGWAF